MANILKHFSKAFEAYKRNFIPVILSVLLIWIVIGLFFGIGFFALLGTGGTTTVIESYMTSEGFTDTYSQELFEQINPQNLGLFFLFLVLGGIVAVFLQAGLWGICFQGIKKKVNMKTFFTTIRERGLSYFFANILIGLIVLAILIPLLVVYAALYFFSPVLSMIMLLFGILMITPFLLFGILIIFPFFVLVYPAVISGKKVAGSITESISLGKKNFSSLMLFFIAIILLVLAVALPSIVFSYAELLLIYPTVYLILMFLEQTIISFLFIPIILLVICSIYLEKSKPAIKKTPERKITKKPTLGKTRQIEKRTAKKRIKKPLGKIKSKIRTRKITKTSSKRKRK